MKLTRSLCLAFALSTVGILSTAASASTIVVNTTADENGENPNACSLREAIIASQTKTAFGGCPAGQQYYTDTIQLDAQTYQLTRGEIAITGNMNIVGSSQYSGDNAQDPLSIDPIMGVEPKRLPLVTKIIATPGQRIFDTSSQNASPINLSYVILQGGSAQQGGAILAGGVVTLNRVQINGATAVQDANGNFGQGGAIFLSGAQATLNATASSFTGNNAPIGSVVAMSCIDNLNYTSRSISIVQSSLTGNGSPASLSTVDLCGLPNVTITSSTIGNNQTSSASAAGALRMVNNGSTQVYSTSIMNLTSNTIVGNSGVGFAYSYTTGLSLTNNIIAYNLGGIDPSNTDCTYIDPNPSTNPNKPNPPPTSATVANNNFFTASDLNVSAASRTCALYTVVNTADTNAYVLKTDPMSNYLNALGLYGGSDLPGYLPNPGSSVTTRDTSKNNPNKILSKGATTALCGGSTDQRGLLRGSGVNLIVSNNSTQSIPCNIGALEFSFLTANDAPSGSNIPYSTVINSTVDTTGMPTAQANAAVKSNSDYITNYKNNFHYREVVMDVLGGDTPFENVTGNTSVLDLLSDATKYTVTGSGTSASSNIECDWIPSMERMIAYRKDGTITAGGNTDSCAYTITNNANGQIMSSGNMHFTISNQAPIANNDSYTLTFGTKSIPLNILANDSDDNDGPTSSIGYPTITVPTGCQGATTQIPKPVFYVDYHLDTNNCAVAIPANIRIVTAPTQGHIVAQYTEPCANNNVNTTPTTCIGGTMTYVNDNLYSPFNDSFTYQVLDEDMTPSTTATVTITNTATTTDYQKSGGGGGSIGWASALALLSLVYVRRRSTSDSAA